MRLLVILGESREDAGTQAGDAARSPVAERRGSREGGADRVTGSGFRTEPEGIVVLVELVPQGGRGGPRGGSEEA